MSSRIFPLSWLCSNLTCPAPLSFHSPESLSKRYSLHFLRAHAASRVKGWTLLPRVQGKPANELVLSI